MSAPGEGRCTRCSSEIQASDLRCPLCGEGVPIGSVVAPDVAVVRQMRCDDCGAATRYDPDAGGSACPFCAATSHVEEIHDPTEQTESWLPFLVDQDEAQQSLRHWLGALAWYRPSDLRSEARVQSLRPLFWVGWAFDAQALVSWTADSDAGSRRSSWAPHSGQTPLRFDDLVISASRGLREAEAWTLTPSYRLDTALERPDGANAPVIEQFDVQRSQARRLILQGIAATAAERLKQGTIPGRSFREVNVETVLEGLETRRLGFPAWVLAYRYGERSYRVVISGQDAGCLKGEAPVSWVKILGAVLGVLLAVLVAILAAVG